MYATTPCPQYRLLGLKELIKTRVSLSIHSCNISDSILSAVIFRTVLKHPLNCFELIHNSKTISTFFFRLWLNICRDMTSSLSVCSVSRVFQSQFSWKHFVLKPPCNSILSYNLKTFSPFFFLRLKLNSFGRVLCLTLSTFSPQAYSSCVSNSICARCSHFYIHACISSEPPYLQLC